MDKNVRTAYGKSVPELLNWARKELDSEEKHPNDKRRIDKK